MRQTKKCVNAIETLKALGEKPRPTMGHDYLYDLLANSGYVWNSKTGVWEKGSSSVFRTANQEPSGVVKIRIMAHPQDVDKALALIQSTVGLRVIEHSEHYINERGSGVRIYIDAILKD